MNKVNKISNKAWFWPVVAVGALVLLSRGAAIPAFASIFKLFLPFIGIYAGYRFVKWRIKKSILKSFENASNNFQQFNYSANMGQQRPRGPQSEMRDSVSLPSDVIEICPKCGREKSSTCPERCQ